MDILLIIKSIAILLAVVVLILFFVYREKDVEHLSIGAKIKTSIMGLVANIGDTFGVGSFASIIAMRRIFGIMPDEANLIGSMNLQAMVTALVQALIFLHFVNVDLVTLTVSCVMIALGGMVSGFVAVNVSRNFIRKVMFLAFCVTGVILLLSQLGVFTVNNVGNGLTGYKLVIFAIFMFISGLLPAFGVGYYSLVQIFIFIMGANPIIAFPIMATASAFQMPATSVPFVIKRKFYFTSTLLLMVFGTIGVFMAAPLIANVNSYYLKWILFIVILYNIIMLSRTRTIKK
ncbi:MAG: hypothetical protein ACK5Z5_00810 [Neisseriaceae bacterium]